MVNHKESITSYQASAIIANTTLGASMMILPRAMARSTQLHLTAGLRSYS